MKEGRDREREEGTGLPLRSSWIVCRAERRWRSERWIVLEGLGKWRHGTVTLVVAIAVVDIRLSPVLSFK